MHVDPASFSVLSEFGIPVHGGSRLPVKIGSTNLHCNDMVDYKSRLSCESVNESVRACYLVNWNDVSISEFLHISGHTPPKFRGGELVALFVNREHKAPGDRYVESSIHPSK
jgi:hypothetical protein